MGAGGDLQGKGPRPHSSRATFRFAVWERSCLHHTELQKGPSWARQEGEMLSAGQSHAAWNTTVWETGQGSSRGRQVCSQPWAA